MPIRIYALAKELKVDSKELVELCAKAGITGKGSALASLTDEELDRVKAFLQTGGLANRIRRRFHRLAKAPAPLLLRLTPLPQLRRGFAVLADTRCRGLYPR